MEQQIPMPSISIAESLSRSWNAVVSKNIWIIAGFTFLYYLVTGVASLIPFLGMAFGLLGFIYSVSMFSAFHKIEKNDGELTFNDFFSWSPKFGKLFVAYLVMLLMAVVMVTILMILIFATLGVGFFTDVFQGNTPDVSGNVLMMLGLLAILFLAVMFLFFIYTFGVLYLTQFRDMSLSESLSMSWKIGKANAGKLFLFGLLATGISLLGLMALVVGLLIAIPVISGMQYYFLRSMFPDERQQEQWDFMKENA
jgi:uncharacterized membrane protein